MIKVCILQDQKCTDPGETECEGACFSYLASGRDSLQHRGCAPAMAVAFVELDDNEKKCTTIKEIQRGVDVQVCMCNYDGCNQNMENPTNQSMLYGLGKALKCSKCNDHYHYVGVSVKSQL